MKMNEIKIKNIDIDELKKVVELLAKNHKCPNCPWNDKSGCGTRIEKRCIKSKEYWINYLNNVDIQEYKATVELVLNGTYEYI